MKLSVRRTALVGLGFLSISAFWGVYDFTVPLILKNTYQISDTIAGAVMALDNIVALFLLPFFGALSDKCSTRIGRRMPFILGGSFAAAILLMVLSWVVKSSPLPAFLLMLGLLLLTMGTYRSPTVALMPDITPKPLRSKGNAVINLMGSIGGAIPLVLMNFAVIRTMDAQGVLRSDYTLLYVITAALMVVCALVVFFTVPERRLAAEAEAQSRLMEENASQAAPDVPAEPQRKLSSAERKSLMLILCSVSLWFMGYNAVTTAFSKYAMLTLNVTEAAAANCMLVATVGAIISYWPVGLLSTRFGRKRMILFGIATLTVCFFTASLMRDITFLAYVLFALVGLGWASIGVNSLPMVVELASGSDVGKYTGYYYTFSMAAQVLTPILSGALLEHVGYWTLFPYAVIMMTLALITMSQVRHGDVKIPR